MWALALATGRETHPFFLQFTAAWYSTPLLFLYFLNWGP